MKKTKSSTLTEIQEQHRTGNLLEAEQGYLALLKQHPDDVQLLHALALLYAEQGNLVSAQHYLEAAIAKKPKEAVFRIHLAGILKANGTYDKAQQILLDVINDHPTLAVAYNNLGTLYYVQQRYLEAMTHYQKAIDLQNDYLDAYYNLALALTKQGRFEEAKTTYKALLELAPTHPGAQFQLGSLLMQQQQYQEAMQQFYAVEKIHPSHFETQVNLATCYLHLENKDAAKKHYLKALELVSTDAQVLFNLGVIHMQQGLIKEASHYYLLAVKSDPDLYDAHNNLGFILLMTKDKERALFHFREALRLHPHDEAIRHTIRILTKEAVNTSPPAYVRALFDSYANHFEAHLLQSLHYQVPELLYEMVAANKDLTQAKWKILDLGCGTGLCGVLFKSVAESLVGVDISPAMLNLAAEKQCYDRLVQADILSHLQENDEKSELIIAGDVLVYFGDLSLLFNAVYEHLSPQGLFAFTAEKGQKKDYEMTESGRFSHSQSYLDKLIKAAHFQVLERKEVTLRMQNEQAVTGYLYLLKRN